MLGPAMPAQLRPPQGLRTNTHSWGADSFTHKHALLKILAKPVQLLHGKPYNSLAPQRKATGHRMPTINPSTQTCLFKRSSIGTIHRQSTGHFRKISGQTTLLHSQAVHTCVHICCSWLA